MYVESRIVILQINQKTILDIFMPPEWNSGASSFCPVCDSVCLWLRGKKNPLTLAIT